MGRLINTTAMTVDGVIDVSDWFVAEGDHDDAARSLFEGEGTAMLLGRKSYEGFAGFWPTQTGPWADVLNPLPKVVASRSKLGPLEWNATAIEGDAVEGVRRLKAGHAGDLVMSGCGELARELIQAALVDELYFWIHTRIQGPGNRPYEAATVPVRLLEAKQFASGVTLLRYQPLTLAPDQVMLYSDARGVFRIYRMSLDEDSWQLWRAAPGFHQRFIGALRDHGRIVDGRWESSSDGSAWEPDFDVTYRTVGPSPSAPAPQADEIRPRGESWKR